MLPEVVTYQPGTAARRAAGFGLDLNRLFDDRFGRGVNGWSAWSPAADLYETNDEFVLRMGLPGFDPEAIDITVERGILTVSGQRTRDEREEQYSYHVREHTYDRFTRSFSLPSTVNADDVRADFHHGMLVVTLPKASEAKPRKIAISAK